MRRIAVFLLLILAGCQVLAPAPARPTSQPANTPALAQSPVSATIEVPLLTVSPSPFSPARQATLTPVLPTLASLPVTETATPQPHAFVVLFHPDGALYVGDRVSMEVIAPPDGGFRGRKVRLTVGGPAGAQIGEASIEPSGLGGRIQATFLWSWDTSTTPAGEQSLTFSLQPDGPVWTETVTLQPRGQLPADEAQASWATDESDCCLVHYLTHSAAERDLPILLEMIDEQTAKVGQQMGLRLMKPAQVNLIPRLIGHGGFTGSEITLSYLDRNYIDRDPAIIFHHEMVHYMDAHMGGDLKPSMLAEGLAVYLSGGHFKPEPLLPRLAALLPPQSGCSPALPMASAVPAQAPQTRLCGLGRYVPLAELLDHFYITQHEIGYLEGGSLVAFMVDTWGWTAFLDFYKDIHPFAGATAQPGADHGQSQAVEAALGRHFGLSLAQLEARFLEKLKEEPVSPENVADISLTVRFYDSVRRYQSLMDPSAYFLNAWLPELEQMRRNRIVADVFRSPTSPESTGLETMFVTANTYLQQGGYRQAQRLLDALDAILAGLGSGKAQTN